MMVLRVQMAKKQSLYIVGAYRQWNLIENLKTLTSHTLPEQISRLENTMSPITELRDKGHELLLFGDLNIDLW